MNKSTWKDFNPNWEKNPYVYACWVHFPTGSMMLICGVFQFSDYIRFKFRKIHIWSGRLYALSGALQSLSAWVIIPASKGGSEAMVAFSFLNIVYSFTLIMALYYVVNEKNRNIQKHRKYMTVNMAAGLNPLILRIFHPIFEKYFQYESNAYIAAIITTIGVELSLGVLTVLKQDLDRGEFFFQKLSIYKKSIEKQKMLGNKQQSLSVISGKNTDRLDDSPDKLKVIIEESEQKSENFTLGDNENKA